MASVLDRSLANNLLELFRPDVLIFFVVVSLAAYASNAASLSIVNFCCWVVMVCLSSANVGIGIAGVGGGGFIGVIIGGGIAGVIIGVILALLALLAVMLEVL